MKIRGWLSVAGHYNKKFPILTRLRMNESCNFVQYDWCFKNIISSWWNLTLEKVLPVVIIKFWVVKLFHNDGTIVLYKKNYTSWDLQSNKFSNFFLLQKSITIKRGDFVTSCFVVSNQFSGPTIGLSIITWE